MTATAAAAAALEPPALAGGARALRNWLHACGRRVFLIDNSAVGTSKGYEQAEALLQVVNANLLKLGTSALRRLQRLKRAQVLLLAIDTMKRIQTATMLLQRTVEKTSSIMRHLSRKRSAKPSLSRSRLRSKPPLRSPCRERYAL